MTRSARRFLVLGLDGATFDLLDPWMAAGELPFLRSLTERGLRAPLASVLPAKTIPAWYSFATGLDPGRLGIYGFTEPDGGPGRSKIVQTFRPAEAFWDRLSRQGSTVGVVNFPLRAGYPIHGFVLPGMLTDDPPTYPEELRVNLQTALGEPFAPELPPYRDADRAAWMSLALRGVEQRGRASEILIGQFHPDFLFVLFRETDRVQHQHWSELDQPVERVAEDLKSFWRAVDAACARIDRVFRASGGPAVTLVVSDHGAGAARSEFFTNRWLLENGYLKFRNGGDRFRRRAVSRLLEASDRVPLARQVLRPVVDHLRHSARAEKFTKAVAGEATFEGMREQIDWDQTVAYSFPVPEGIYLNPYNPHLTQAEGATIIREIREKLSRYAPAHIEVFEPRELYGGTPASNAPALLLRIDGMATDPRMDFSYPKPFLRQRPGFFYGSGVHRMNGILLAAGDGVPHGREEEPRSLLDIAPTVLEGMGVPVPAGMSGRSFADTLESPGA
ncbi:MAG: alkaline phosphatase family protein [Thermoplasmata archaeon]|nr:alkaline phosphatase family protein [Thermoplasmata archaeon]